MKIIPIIFFFIILFSQQAWSNNVQLGSISLTGQNTTDNFTMVSFYMSWDNSWRYTNGPANWDAVWAFVKYRVNGGPWLHASLNNTGHTSDQWMTLENGLLTPGAPFNSATNPVLGVFIYRNTAGTGTFLGGAQLRWNYGENGVADDAQIDIKVFAIEMVYIPEGSFYVGSGGTETGAFYTYPTTTTPYQITGEGSIPVGSSNGSLHYLNNPGSGDQTGPVPAAYPKGYKAFYAMKYEISQQQYVDFLNTLTRTQQIAKVNTDISGQSITLEFVMSSSSDPTERNGISCPLTIPPQPGLVFFNCNLNNNSTPNEYADGQGIACNFMKYADITSYLDWSGLRLMTEFEFEKCARGPLTPSPNEYAWGNQTVYTSGALQFAGTPDEIPVDINSNTTAGGFPIGPLRVGGYARITSDRTSSGAGYYGCLALSGNVHDRAVSVGTATGRSYTGQHGNGILTASGQQDVPFWPSAINGEGTAIRGAAYIGPLEYQRLSDRLSGAATNGTAQPSSGGRGVRTAE